jgi:hypothetical protein
VSPVAVTIPAVVSPSVPPVVVPTPPRKSLQEKMVERLTSSMNAFLVKKKYYTYSLSTFTIATNAIVAINNFFRHPLLGGGIGSHPLAHKLYAPDYGPASKLNADDAASLLLRLLSETGVVGTLVFIIGVLNIQLRAYKAIRVVEERNMADWSIALGIWLSSGGLFIIYLLRNGFYYDSMFWFMLGMLMAVPNFLGKKNI